MSAYSQEERQRARRAARQRGGPQEALQLQELALPQAVSAPHRPEAGNTQLSLRLYDGCDGWVSRRVPEASL